jgi:hypothetical protein
MTIKLHNLLLLVIDSADYDRWLSRRSPARRPAAALSDRDDDGL